MPSEPPVKRAFVFIDGQNLFHAAKRHSAIRFPTTTWPHSPDGFALNRAGTWYKRTSTAAFRTRRTMPSGTISGARNWLRWGGKACESSHARSATAIKRFDFPAAAHIRFAQSSIQATASSRSWAASCIALTLRLRSLMRSANRMRRCSVTLLIGILG